MKLTPTEITAFAAAIKKAGGLSELASLLGESRQAVHNWKTRGIPPNKVIAVEAATGISRRRLRADWRLYWPADDKVEA